MEPTIREQQIALLKYALRENGSNVIVPEGTIGDEAYKAGYADAIQDAIRTIDNRVTLGIL